MTNSESVPYSEETADLAQDGTGIHINETPLGIQLQRLSFLRAMSRPLSRRMEGQVVTA